MMELRNKKITVGQIALYTLEVQENQTFMKSDEYKNLTENERDAQFIDHMVTVAHIFSGLPKSHCYNVDVEDIARFYKLMNVEVSKLKVDDECKGRVVIDGIEFVFNKEMDKLPAGRVIDIKKLGDKVLEKPYYFLSKLYVSDEVSDKEAVELFKYEFPVSEFLGCLNFFFLKSLGWSTSISLLEAMNQQEINQLMIYHHGLVGRGRLYRWLNSYLIQPLKMCWRSLTRLYYFGKSIS